MLVDNHILPMGLQGSVHIVHLLGTNFGIPPPLVWLIYMLKYTFMCVPTPKDKFHSRTHQFCKAKKKNNTATYLAMPLIPEAPRARHLRRNSSRGSVVVLHASSHLRLISSSWRLVDAMFTLASRLLYSLSGACRRCN